ncbi:MAG: hypothetical protein HUU16_16315 [Candidatus Omnitrophica bacterium]|nr:hypothetical protein [Candidatus Omnitrophota bacterium]
MTPLAFLFALLLAAPSELEPRLANLRAQAERLELFTVGDALQAEKERRLSEIAARIAEEATGTESIKALYESIDATREWLLANAADPPALQPGTLRESEDSWRIENPGLSATLAKKDLSLVFETPGARWEMEPCGHGDLETSGKTLSLFEARERTIEPFRAGPSLGVLITLKDFAEAEGLELYLGVHLSGSEALFEVAAREGPVGVGALHWPKAIRFDSRKADDYSVIPYMQGMLLPANWPKEFIRERKLCHTRYLYMPWFGQVREGKGYQAIFETGFDGGGSIIHPASGPTTLRPMWFSSLGELRYPRRVRYVFDDNAGYVSMAKRYRRFARETGHFVSLREKLARTPALSKVIGKPVIHMGSLYHMAKTSKYYNAENVEGNHGFTSLSDLAASLRKLKEREIEEAYVHLDGWGFRGYDSAHPDPLPPGEEQGGWQGLRDFAATCKEIGYLFAVHDNYRDFYENSVSFDPRLALMRQNGEHPKDSTWCGGPQLFLSARFAPEYVRRNYDLFAENGVELGGAYLDVFAVADLDESFQPAHPMSREDCARYRMDSIELLRSRGFVMSSEEPVDFAVPFLDLVHHGPYPTYPNLGGGDAAGVPVPLFNLVYHDSILLPWEMGEDGGWGIPKGDSGRMHCLLNAGLPYLSPGGSDEHLAQARLACQLAERLAFEEMVNHEFLEEGKRRQRTTYSDGVQITVDFDKGTFQVEPPL